MLAGILSASVSGLLAQSSRIGASADNLANASTAGYKSHQVSTTTLNTHNSSQTSYSAGGVQAVSRQLVDVQGLIGASTTSTDLAISGKGFFAVKPSADSGETFYTRDGSFRPDNQGNLVNSSGFYLQGRDASGNLAPVNMGGISGAAEATTSISIGANLPADAPLGETFNIDVLAHTSLGEEVSISLSFEKKGPQHFTLSIGDVTSNATGAVIGTATEDSASGAPYSVDVFFSPDPTKGGYDRDGDGTIDSSVPPGVYVQFPPVAGSENLDISLDLENLTAFAGDFTIGNINADGNSRGTFSGIEFAADGSAIASFSDGSVRVVGEVPLALFSNENGLEALTGNVWRATEASGSPTITTPGSAGAGSVQGGALELSTVDVGTEFVNMILAENAYNASLRAISATDDMSKTLFDAVS